MIAIFTYPKDSQFTNWVKDAIQLADLSHASVEIIPLDRGGLEARSYAETIRQTNACVVDMDQMDIFSYAVQLGSLGRGLSYLTGVRENRYWPSILDTRLMLVTRLPLKNHRVIDYFGDYYSTISLENGITEDITRGLADWIRNTVASSVPRIFISYRSLQIEYTRQIAQFLKTRGAAIWFDELSISPGGSIPAEINRGLGWCTHLAMIVDETFFDSRWTQVEVESVLYRHLNRFHHFRMRENPRPLIPLFLVDPDDASMPIVLQRIRGIDCRNKTVEEVVEQLWTAITSVGPR